ncbi:MAG: hypothetical protein RLZZ292_3622 [Bacteroidota bacterium]|jgi:predicted ATP-binding protein involved in virulence
MENSITDLHEQVYAHLTKNYPDLTFSLRKINRSRRLEAGYWLYGAEWYVRFSFWDTWIQGSNQLTLNLSIYLDNPTELWLDFYLHHDKKVHEFREKVAPIWGMESDENSYDTYSKKISKPEDKNDITKALDRFIQQEKIIIDTFIKSEDMNVFFPSFDRENFLHYKEKIEKHRKNLSYKPFTEQYTYKPIKINTIALENITCIAPTNIDFHKNVTCFIGLNGTSKTSLLRAITLGLVGSNFVNSIPLPYMVNITEQKGGIVWAETANIKSEFLVESEKVPSKPILFRSEENTLPTIFQEEDTALVADENYLHTLVLAFPQQRGSSETEKDKSIKESKPNIYDFSSLLNNESDNRFKKISEWIFDIHNDILNKDNPTGELNPIRDEAFNLIFDIISAITNQNISIKTKKYDGKLVWLNIDDRTELLGLSSQGIENLFVWIGVLVQRLYRIHPSILAPDEQQPLYKNLTDIPAIVLIDEIDTYLHISVQQKILAVLVEKFPNIQFIVTTHSPYTIGSIPNDKIKIYVCKKEGESVEVEAFNDFTPYGADVERLSEMLGLTNGTRPPKTKETLNRITDLIAEGKLDEAEQAIEDFKNDKSFGLDANDPALVQQEMFLETKKMWAAE